MGSQRDRHLISFRKSLTVTLGFYGTTVCYLMFNVPKLALLFLAKEDVFMILYEEVCRYWFLEIYQQFIQVHEEEVEVVHTFDPASQLVEDYYYPHPAKNNAKTRLKLLVFQCGSNHEASFSYVCHSTRCLFAVACSLKLKNCDCLYHYVNFSLIVVNTLYVLAGCMEGKQYGSSC